MNHYNTCISGLLEDMKEPIMNNPFIHFFTLRYKNFNFGLTWNTYLFRATKSKWGKTGQRDC